MADTAAKLRMLEQRFNRGDKNALATAVLLVLGNGLEVPAWVRLAFVKAFADVTKARVKSWDEVLGHPHKGKHLPDVRRRAELCFPVWKAGQGFRRNGIRVGPALWEQLADEFGIGQRLARELYYRVESVVKQTQG